MGLSPKDFICCCQNRDEQCVTEQFISNLATAPSAKVISKVGHGHRNECYLEEATWSHPRRQRPQACLWSAFQSLSTEGGPRPAQSPQCTQRRGLHLEGSPDLTERAQRTLIFQPSCQLSSQAFRNKTKNCPSKSCQDFCFFLSLLASVLSGNLIHNIHTGRERGRDTALEN